MQKIDMEQQAAAAAALPRRIFAVG